MKRASRNDQITTVRLSNVHVDEWKQILALYPDTRLRQLVERAIHDTYERLVVPQQVQGAIKLVVKPQRT